MNHPADKLADFSASAMIEGYAHVVALDGNMAWLEPEQTSSCGGCAASGTCGSKGMGTTASRLEARRFQIENEPGLRIGDRVVVGIRENALLKASITAYVIPLAALLGSGALAQWAFGSDGITMVSMVGGLAFGLWLSRLDAARLFMRGDISPRFIRRASMGESCNFE